MEFVYVVSRSDLFNIEGVTPSSIPHGFHMVIDFASAALPALSNYSRKISHHGFFMERDYAEQCSDFKQIIPYCLVIKRKGPELFVFRYERLTGGSEERLHNKASIGVGGHINPEDVEDQSKRGFIANCVWRELHEELIINKPKKFENSALGLINDDTNPVGSVHFGWVTMVWVDDAEVREKDTLKGEFVRFQDLLKDTTPLDAYETWSQ